MFVFFFSSRRRHTRFDCDWSSDVCSSDLLDSLAATFAQSSLCVCMCKQTRPNIHAASRWAFFDEPSAYLQLEMLEVSGQQCEIMSSNSDSVRREELNALQQQRHYADRLQV